MAGRVFLYWHFCDDCIQEFKSLDGSIERVHVKLGESACQSLVVSLELLAVGCSWLLVPGRQSCGTHDVSE